MWNRISVTILINVRIILINQLNLNNMYIVIEAHGGPEYAAIVTNEDGENMVFETPEEAQAEADDCQDGIVVEL